jgi:hypothetical protein
MIGEPPSSKLLGMDKVTVYCVEFINNTCNGGAGTFAARTYAIGEYADHPIRFFALYLSLYKTPYSIPTPIVKSSSK